MKNRNFKLLLLWLLISPLLVWFWYCEYSSMECQLEYNLIPINNVDLNYCVSNDLCPVSTWLNESELIINDIVHESAPLININIPEEISWDYTWNENSFDLFISGYNVDTEYISDIILTQKTPANRVDLNNIIQVLLPLFVPWLIIILFIYFVFKFIKKIF